MIVTLYDRYEQGIHTIQIFWYHSQHTAFAQISDEILSDCIVLLQSSGWTNPYVSLALQATGKQELMIRKKLTEELVGLYFFDQRDGFIENDYHTMNNELYIFKKTFVDYLRTKKRR